MRGRVGVARGWWAVCDVGWPVMGGAVIAGGRRRGRACDAGGGAGACAAWGGLRRKHHQIVAESGEDLSASATSAFGVLPGRGGAALEAKPVLVRLGAILGSNLVMLAPKTHSSLLRWNRNLCWLGLGL